MFSHLCSLCSFFLLERTTLQVIRLLLLQVDSDGNNLGVECLEGHDGPITGCGRVVKNDHVATAGVDQTFRIWDLNSCRLISKVSGCGSSASLATSPNGCLAALGSTTGVVR